MKKSSSLIALAFLAVVASAHAASESITAARFTYESFAYFRGKAENLRLGSYGKKKTPVNDPNYMTYGGDVDAANLAKVDVKIVGPFGIDWAKQSNTDVNAAISYLTAIGGTASFSRDAATKAKLQLVKFVISETQLQKLLNEYAGAARNYMKDGGGDTRIVSEVWVAVDATLGQHISTCGSVSGEGSGGGFAVKIDTKACKTTISSVTIPTNTTFAYSLHKVKKWDKDKVEKLEGDNPGLN